MIYQNPTRLEIQDEAKRLHDGGLWLTPVKTDGTKAPIKLEWNSLRRCWAELRPFWNCVKPYGIAIVLGETWTEGLYHFAFDFDDEDTFDELLYDIPDCVIVATPDNGYHCHFLTREKYQSEVIAADSEGHPLVELKGIGSKCIAPGGPLSVHLSGKPYRIVLGDLDAIPEISAEEVREFIVLCRHHDKRIPVPLTGRGQGNDGRDKGERPGDYFNRDASWDDILLPHGWRAVGRSVIEQSDMQNNGWKYYRRPGAKSRGHDAAVNDNDLLVVFSPSCWPFQQGRYPKFKAYTLLNYGGLSPSHYALAASEIKRQGFGAPAYLSEWYNP